MEGGGGPGDHHVSGHHVLDGAMHGGPPCSRAQRFRFSEVSASSLQLRHPDRSLGPWAEGGPMVLPPTRHPSLLHPSSPASAGTHRAVPGKWPARRESLDSPRAAELARTVAATGGDEVLVVHIVEMLVGRAHGPVELDGDSEAIERASQHVKELEAAGVTARVELIRAPAGHVAKVIAEAAEQYGAGLI